jgi:SSS family transporter
MEDYRNLITMICVSAYMAACVAVGLWAMRRTKNSRDFFMAGHSLGAIVAGVAIFSSTLSGFGFIGGPGLVYRMGISSVWMVICASIGFCLTFHLLGKRMRLLAGVRKAISLPDLVAARYGSELTRLLMAVAILLGVMAYLGSQIKAMAIALQLILAENPLLSDLSSEWCVIISSAVLVFYCVTGGIIASVYTDLFQGLVMVVAALLIFLAAATSLPGGFTEISQTIAVDDPEAMSPWGTLGILGCLSWYFLFALGGTGQPHVITKMMMNKSVRDNRTVLPLSLLGYGLSALLWIGIGLTVRALVVQGLPQSEMDQLANPDNAAPWFLQNKVHPILAGIVFAGLFAAIMSTADGFLNIGAAAIVHDIPTALRGRSLLNELFWARVATLVLAVAAAVFSVYSPHNMIALLGAYGWGVFAGAIAPVVAIGFNWKRATAVAANLAIASSLVINIGFMLLQKIWDWQLPYHISGGAVTLVISSILFIVVSLNSKPNKIDPLIEAALDV